MSKRCFFLGAGASRADGFPLTKHIICGAIYEALANESRYKRPLTFLRVVFGLTDSEPRAAASLWETFLRSPDAAADPAQLRVPDVVELLSLLDLLIVEELTAAGERTVNGQVDAFGGRALSRVRERTSRAIAASIAALARARRESGFAASTAELVSLLRPDDVVITTNWDLLLDRELHFRFGTDPEAIGSDVIITEGKDARAVAASGALSRPPLFKLHGSLNWLTCFRCTRLFVNPTYHTADFGFQQSTTGRDDTCDCGMPLRAILITPTFFKQYRNRHLANIWANAQQRLAPCAEWFFIGYSLPADDVHIRAFLLRAFLLRALHMRPDGSPLPYVTVVTEGDELPTRLRYLRLFRKVDLFADGFAAFLPTLKSCA